MPGSAVVQETLPEYFKLDPDFMRQLDNISANVEKLKLQEFDTGFLYEKLAVPSVENFKSK